MGSRAVISGILRWQHLKWFLDGHCASLLTTFKMVFRWTLCSFLQSFRWPHQLSRPDSGLCWRRSFLIVDLTFDGQVLPGGLPMDETGNDLQSTRWPFLEILKLMFGDCLNSRIPTLCFCNEEFRQRHLKPTLEFQHYAFATKSLGRDIPSQTLDRLDITYTSDIQHTQHVTENGSNFGFKVWSSPVGVKTSFFE